MIVCIIYTYSDDQYLVPISIASKHQEESIVQLPTSDDDEAVKYCRPSYVHLQEGSLTESICTRDLIYWSFQIAKAMDYLASIKVGLIFITNQIYTIYNFPI